MWRTSVHPRENNQCRYAEMDMGMMKRPMRRWRSSVSGHEESGLRFHKGGTGTRWSWALPVPRGSGLESAGGSKLLEGCEQGRFLI